MSLHFDGPVLAQSAHRIDGDYSKFYRRPWQPGAAITGQRPPLFPLQRHMGYGGVLPYVENPGRQGARYFRHGRGNFFLAMDSVS